MAEKKGYLNKTYAEAFKQIGNPIKLKYSNGWILKRKIPGTKYYDAMGCYPLFMCLSWVNLHRDIKEIENDLVSLSVVTDPFGNFNENILYNTFVDVVIPFKEHFIIDLNKFIEQKVSKNHQRNSKKSLKNLDIEICQEPDKYIKDWIDLYENLKERHTIKGITKFSNYSFEKQFKVPGLTKFIAKHNNQVLGMVLFYENDDKVYYHLASYCDLGYKMNASFAIFWEAIKYYKKENYRWIDLGAGEGLKPDSSDGLTRFKKGWATDKKNVYFCGKIFDKELYNKIVKSKNHTNEKYFPAYRKGEFGS
jgi:hypothetical protein